jgi:hypothetical protein
VKSAGCRDLEFKGTGVKVWSSGYVFALAGGSLCIKVRNNSLTDIGHDPVL